MLNIKIKVSSEHGWNTRVENVIVDLCKQHNAVFINRAAVGSDQGKQSGIRELSHVEGQTLPVHMSYVFFAHRGMADLPFTEEIVVDCYVDDGKEELRDSIVR